MRTSVTNIPNVLNLTHWGRDKINNISQTTFSNVFSSMKMFEFRLKFHWSLFPMVQLTIFQHWFRWWLGAVQATSHYLNQWWLVYRRIYASLGLNELSNKRHPITLKRKGRQDNCPKCHWRRWKQALTFPVTSTTVVLTTFPILWFWTRGQVI